ncbi:MAG: HAMP domain-containing histidine kinase, partial [Kiritimatiellae bacterium]|nr:HAMP domain-containing histidine kinase [Kiritimatiellia bacterium]
PVVTFSATARGPGGESLEVELGLRREAVEKEEWGAMRAVDSMYRLCAAGWAGMVLLGAGGVAWMRRRDEKREKARRMEEHLAFSGVLANGIVHDFRNPMSSLRLDAQLLEQEAGRGDAARLEKVREWSGRLKGTLDRMEGVFREFLALAKPGEGGGMGRVDLLACAEECAEMLKPRFEASGVAVETAGERGVAVARANESWLKRATLNILANAQQHAKGAVRVRASREGGRVRLEVEDDGPGIPKADREKVFEMFHTTRPQGTGLGLYLARLAAEKCGGRIWAGEGRGGGALLVMEFGAADDGGET